MGNEKKQGKSHIDAVVGGMEMGIECSLSPKPLFCNTLLLMNETCSSLEFQHYSHHQNQ